MQVALDASSAHILVEKFYSLPGARAQLIQSAWSRAQLEQPVKDEIQEIEIHQLWTQLLRDHVVPLLRGSDNRLVRVRPSEATCTSRATLVAAGFPHVLHHILRLSNHLLEPYNDTLRSRTMLLLKAAACEALTHLIRSNPVQRSMFTDAVTSIVPLIRITPACAHAAEALSIMCFECPENSRRVLAFYKDRLGQALEEVIEVVKARDAPPRARMWAAVLLRNLAADVFAAASGLSQMGVAKVYEGARVRSRLACNDVLQTLVVMALQGPSSAQPPSQMGDDRGWEHDPPGMVAWAAAGAIASMAISAGVSVKLVQAGALEALFALFLSSDPLEACQAGKALSAIVVDTNSHAIICEWFRTFHGEFPMSNLRQLNQISQEGRTDMDPLGDSLDSEEQAELARAYLELFHRTGKLHIASEGCVII